MHKICVVSFDHWGYDKYIVDELRRFGVESYHIKLSEYKYENSFERLKNTACKIFLNKNLKHIWRQNFALQQLERLGFQNQILVINPELIDYEYHLRIKKYTNKYIAYLYDSVSRYPIDHLLNGVFDEIFSFDKEDVAKYSFNQISNYIYSVDNFFKSKIKKIDYFYIGSIDDRIIFLNDFAEILKKQNKSFYFLAVGKKSFVMKLKQFFLNEFENITFTNNRLSHEKILKLYGEALYVLDIVRPKQSGISFRVFECMGINTNVVSTNKNLCDYDLINSGKIFILNPNIVDYAFKDQYSEHLIAKYYIKNWVKKVFKI